jgi:hypothetical protein
MNTQSLTELRQYAWNYFSLHADQRMKTFNFYIVLCGALVAGMIATRHSAIGAMLAYLIGFVSFIFWKMDQRIRQLVKHGENALKHLEDQVEADALRIFQHEEKITEALPQLWKRWPLAAHFTYSMCFDSVFFVFGFGSVIVGCILLWNRTI